MAINKRNAKTTQQLSKTKTGHSTTRRCQWWWLAAKKGLVEKCWEWAVPGDKQYLVEKIWWEHYLLETLTVAWKKKKTRKNKKRASFEKKSSFLII